MSSRRKSVIEKGRSANNAEDVSAAAFNASSSSSSLPRESGNSTAVSGAAPPQATTANVFDMFDMGLRQAGGSNQASSAASAKAPNKKTDLDAAFDMLSVGSGFQDPFGSSPLNPFAAPTAAQSEPKKGEGHLRHSSTSLPPTGRRFSQVAIAAGFDVETGNPFDSSSDEEDGEDGEAEVGPGHGGGLDAFQPRQPTHKRKDSRIGHQSSTPKGQSAASNRKSANSQIDEGEEGEGEGDGEQIEGQPNNRANEEEKKGPQPPSVPFHGASTDAFPFPIIKIPVSPEMMQGAALINVDVLDMMKKGTPFLKYGRSGFPHFRQFLLSDDNTKVIWFSKGKKIKDTQIDWSDVSDFRLGQTTENFSKHPAQDLAKASFSLIYGKEYLTLDLIAKDPNEYIIWRWGISKLLEFFNKNGREATQQLKKLIVLLPVKAGRRSVLDIDDAVSGTTAQTILGKLFKSDEIRSGINNKHLYTEVAKNAMALKAKLAKREEEMKDRVYYNSVQYDKMLIIIAKIKKSMERISDWFQCGEYQKCDDEIWRAGVDMDSLKNMMHVAKGGWW